MLVLVEGLAMDLVIEDKKNDKGEVIGKKRTVLLFQSGEKKLAAVRLKEETPAPDLMKPAKYSGSLMTWKFGDAPIDYIVMQK